MISFHLAAVVPWIRIPRNLLKLNDNIVSPFFVPPTGDNSDIIATDSQKNTVYLLAKKYGIKSPEDFAITLTKHFLSKYRHVKEAHVHVQEYPWDRIRYQNADNKTGQHNHAFVFTPVAIRYCDVIHQRTGKHQPHFISSNSKKRNETRQSRWHISDDAISAKRAKRGT